MNDHDVPLTVVIGIRIVGMIDYSSTNLELLYSIKV